MKMFTCLSSTLPLAIIFNRSGWKPLFMSKRNRVTIICAAVLLTLNWNASGALTTYPGNGNVTYAGAIADGSLQLNDNGTYISGTLTKGGGSGVSLYNLAIFIDCQPGGFNNTTA